MSNFDRYQQIAPLYDLLDLPFERQRLSGVVPFDATSVRSGRAGGVPID
jgi:hypothetical protein